MIKDYRKKTITKLLIIFISFSFAALLSLKQNYQFIQQVKAQACPVGYSCRDGCTKSGQCIDNDACFVDPNYSIIRRDGQHPCGSSIIGHVVVPNGVYKYNMSISDKSGVNIGILVFASKILKLVDIIAGLLVFTNFMLAGYSYITAAGNTSVYNEVKDKLTYSVVGIVIIVVAYTAAALIGLIFFGNAGFILNPNITKYGALAP